MSDIRFNQWLHQSGTGGVSQDHIGNIGIGTTNPSIVVSAANTAVLNVGVITANNLFVNNAFNGDITGNVTGNISGATGTFSGNVDIADKIIHTGDTDTAMRFPADNTFAVDTAGSERLRIDSSGNMQVSTGQFTVGTTASTGLQLINDGTFGTIQSADLKIRTAATERLRIDSNGNLGVNKTPETDWNGSYRAIEIGNSSISAYQGNTYPSIELNMNCRGTQGSYSAGWKYIRSMAATQIHMPYDGNVLFRRAASGSADGAITWSESMRITSAGRIGINETSPSHVLDVKSQAAGTYFINGQNHNGNNIFQVYESSDGDGNHGMLYLNNGSGTTLTKISTNGPSYFNGGSIGINETSPDRTLHVNSGATDTALKLESTDTEVSLELADNTGSSYIGGGGSYLNFYSGGNERLRITSDGDLTTANITISGYSNTHNIGNYSVFLSDNHANTFFGQNLRLDYSSNSGNHQLKVINQHAQIGGAGMLIGGNQSSNRNQLNFYTVAANQPAGTRVDDTNKRLTIESSGRVVIHGDGTIRNSWPGAACSIHNLAMVDAGSGFSWGIRGNSGDTQWCLERIVGTNSFSDSNIKFRVYNNGNYTFAGSSTSDRDIKENIEDISGTSLNLIDQLRPRTFNFKESEGYSTEPKTGFVAQEIGAVIPSIVNGTDGQKDMGVDYNGLVAHLVKAVQELKAENDSLRSRLDTAGL